MASTGSFNPRRMLLVYAIALTLVLGHEFNRVMNWLEEFSLICPALTGLVQPVQNVRRVLDDWGLSRLIAAENAFLAEASSFPELAARPAALEKIRTAAVPTAPKQSAGPTGPAPDPLGEGGIKTGLVLLSGLPPGRGSIPATAETLGNDLKPDQPAAALPKESGPKKHQAKTVLVAGDSMILEGFGVVLQRALKAFPGLNVVREGRYSTGLSRPDYFDWRPYLKELIEKHKPDLLILSLGANDPQDILDENRKRLFVASEGWNQAYEARAKELLALVREKGVLTIWVGLPIMGPATYSTRIANLNAVAKKACEASPRCVFVDTWQVLADANGKYATFLKDEKGRYIRVRASDNIHLTEAGGEIMVKYFFQAASAHVDFAAPAGQGRVEASVSSDTGTASASSPSAAAPKQDAALVASPRSALAPSSVETGTGGLTTVVPAPAPASFHNQNGELTVRAADVRIEMKSFFSQVRGKETSYYAFIPLTQAGPSEFPVLYLLHGAWDGYQAWKEHAEEKIKEAVRKYGLIVVTPDGDPFGWYADSPFDPANRIESYFIRELIPHVEANLPVRRDRAGLTGLSMGGHGAFILALRHPGRFIAISSMSGVLDVTRHHGQWQLNRVFGPFTPENIPVWREHSAYFLSLSRKEALSALSILITVSTGDPWVLAENKVLHQKLLEMGVRHEYVESPGRHEWSYWLAELPRHAAFQARALNAGVVR
ncbi:MAG: DUF459 domain-containing protein [Thermodesulfobacteriota bacterium]